MKINNSKNKSGLADFVVIVAKVTGVFALIIVIIYVAYIAMIQTNRKPNEKLERTKVFGIDVPDLRGIAKPQEDIDKAAQGIEDMIKELQKKNKSN